MALPASETGGFGSLTHPEASMSKSARVERLRVWCAPVSRPRIDLGSPFGGIERGTSSGVGFVPGYSGVSVAVFHRTSKATRGASLWGLAFGDLRSGDRRVCVTFEIRVRRASPLPCAPLLSMSAAPCAGQSVVSRQG